MPSHDTEYEAEVLPGVEPIALRELEDVAGRGIRSARIIRPGFLRFNFRGETQRLCTLRSVVAVYQVHRFDVPRPKALLGHQHFTRLVKLLQQTMANFDVDRPSLGIGAAGAGSTVFRRLKDELASALDVPAAQDDKGELYLRIVRSADKQAWEALIRLTAQPLSKRRWRIVDSPGALNATVAYAMSQLSPPQKPETVLNLCCGTATLSIEYALTERCGLLLALDMDKKMLAAARANIRASGTTEQIQLLHADAMSLPLPSGSVDLICADLPFGHHIGSHRANLEFYPIVLREAARVAADDARFVLLTHEINLMRRLLDVSDWQTLSEAAINLSGLHPRLFVLRRKSNRI